MVTLPPEFTATKYLGYFWNTKDHQLYSLKVGGYLKPMVLTKPNKWNQLTEPVYRVSVDGRRRYLTLSSLTKLKEPKDSTIPVGA